MKNSMDEAGRVSKALEAAMFREFGNSPVSMLAAFVGYLMNLLGFIDAVSEVLPIPLPDSMAELKNIAEKCLMESSLLMSELDAQHNRRN